MNKLTQQFLDLAPARWESVVAKYNPSNARDSEAISLTIQNLEHIAICATRAAVYLQTMYLKHHTPQQLGAHHLAVRLQNQAATQVRRALGFSTPKHDILF